MGHRVLLDVIPVSENMTTGSEVAKQARGEDEVLPLNSILLNKILFGATPCDAMTWQLRARPPSRRPARASSILVC